MIRKSACSVCLENCSRLHGAEEEGGNVNGGGCLRCDLRNQKEEVVVANVQVDRHPSFLKKITESTMSTLKLPLSFVGDHNERLGESVMLEGPGKEQWRVELQRSFPSVNFGQGWEQFVVDHVLQIGDQLYFSLSEKSYFQVEVYDGFGVTKRSALDATNTSLGRGNVKNVELKDLLSVDDAPVARRQEHDKPENGTQPADHSLIDLAQSSESESRVMSAPENVMEIAEPDGPEVSGRPAMELGEIDKGGQLLPPHTTFGGKVVSQRRPVTELEKAQTLEGARALKLVNPSTLVVMYKCHVYQGFWLAIPKPFARIWLPSESKEITLINKSGHKWPGKWLAPQGGLSAGWRRFSLDHRLEEHDVCVLELVDKAEHTFLVHIFPVLRGGEEDPGLYTPLQRCEGRRNNRKSFPAVSSDDKAHCTPQKGQESVKKFNANSIWESSSGTKFLKRKFCLPEDDEAPGSLAKAKSLGNGQDRQNVGKFVNHVDEKFDNGPGNEVALDNAFELRAPCDAESNETPAPQVLGPSRNDLVKLGKNLSRGLADQLTAQAGSADEVHEQILNFADMSRPAGDQRSPPIEVRKKDQLYKVVHIYKGRGAGCNTDYLTEIEGYTEGSSATTLDRDDDTGFWWIPSDQFEWDMQRCRIE